MRPHSLLCNQTVNTEDIEVALIQSLVSKKPRQGAVQYLTQQINQRYCWAHGRDKKVTVKLEMMDMQEKAA